MAVRNWKYTQVHGGLMEAEVTGLLNGDETDDLQLPGYPDKTFDIRGTEGVGLVLNIRGAQITDASPANYLDLHRADAPTLTLTALAPADVPKLVSIIENPKLIKANISAGDGTTNMAIRVEATTGR